MGPRAVVGEGYQDRLQHHQRESRDDRDQACIPDAFKARRCIIPADAFYEWKKLDAKRKQPYAIVPKDGGVFSFAGLWERWKDRASGETLRTCTIVTTEPNELCAPIH